MYVRLVSIFRHAYTHIEVNLINNFVNSSPPLDNWISSLNRDINNYLKYMHILMFSRIPLLYCVWSFCCVYSRHAWSRINIWLLSRVSMEVRVVLLVFFIWIVKNNVTNLHLTTRTQHYYQFTTDYHNPKHVTMSPSTLNTTNIYYHLSTMKTYLTTTIKTTKRSQLI
jgi:hypothetical protein